MKTIYMDTLGCSKNQVDSDRIRTYLENRGFSFVPAEQAETILVNTCGFIQPAVEEGLERILELADLKEQGKLKHLVVMGCMTQRYQGDLEAELPEVDVFLGTGYLEGIEDYLIPGKKASGYIMRDRGEGTKLLAHLPSKSYAYLKVAEGCNNNCTYCIIPKLRGPFRSRNLEEIVKEAGQYLRLGVKELIVIAQDTSRYGQDQGTSLLELLKRLNALEGEYWIRLQYLYPDTIDEQFIEALSHLSHVVPYFDIPIQHASDHILKLMNRHTSKEQIRSLMKAIRRHYPESAIRTSIIVGFPGETDQDFEELLQFISEEPFDRLGVFSYWDEPESASSKLPDKVDDDIKAQRQRTVLRVQESISQNLLEQRIGRIYRSLIDEEGIARTAFEAPDVDGIVSFTGNYPLGTFVKLKIIGSSEHDLEGELYEPRE